MKIKYFIYVQIFFWALFILALPISSFPILAKLIHSSSVAPASLIPAIILIPVWLIPYLKNYGAIPAQLKIFFLFVAFALISTFLAFFLFVPAYKENSLIKAVIEGIVTLFIGALFLIISSAFPRNDTLLRITLLTINISGISIILITLVQIFFLITMNGGHPEWLLHFQLRISTTTLFANRTTGLASEPSWFAHQLNIVYLPYWLSASVKKFTVHKKKIFNKISIENILLLFGIVCLISTYSRVGLAAFFLVIGFLFIIFNIKIIKQVQSIIKPVVNKFLIKFLLIVFVITAYLGLLIGGIYIFSKVDPRMKSVFAFDNLNNTSIMKYFDTLQFGERVAYWQTGWNIFNDHPIFGVGLGVAGFFFPENMPNYGWQMTETRDLFYRSAGLMNIKCFWIRILAETGIIGFSLFLIFLLGLFFSGLYLMNRKKAIYQTIGWMGIFMMIAYILEGFSIDTFALPYFWFTIGLVFATFRNATQQRELR